MKENSYTYPNIITYNCILDACVKSDDMEKATFIFAEMLTSETIRPDLITYSTLIKSHCKTGELKKAYDLFQQML